MSNIKNIKNYYLTKESRWGYQIFLGGAKHFGYYDKGDFSLNFPKALRKMERKLGTAINLKADDKVLDAGCGMGIVSRSLASTFGYNVTGIDILDFNLENCLKKAKQNKNLNLTYYEMDYHKLDFPESEFNGIYTIETFVHSSDPEKVIKEFYRVLKPGGKLVHFEYSHDPYSSMEKNDVAAFKFVNKYSEMPAFDMFEHGVHESLLVKNGFRVISSNNHAQNIKPMMFWFKTFAWLPVKIYRLFGKEYKIVNAVSAVDFWRLRSKIHYNIIIAEKV